MEVPDDPSMFAQAQARLHRSGQRAASVSMVYLLTLALTRTLTLTLTRP